MLYVYDLLEKRKYREEGQRYIGPCRVVSKHKNLESIFPGSFIFKGEKGQEYESFDNTVYPVQESQVEPVDSELKPVHRGGGRFNVENNLGESINGEYLTKEEAYELCGLEV